MSERDEGSAPTPAPGHPPSSLASAGLLTVATTLLGLLGSCTTAVYHGFQAASQTYIAAQARVEDRRDTYIKMALSPDLTPEVRRMVFGYLMIDYHGTPLAEWAEYNYGLAAEDLRNAVFDDMVSTTRKVAFAVEDVERKEATEAFWAIYWQRMSAVNDAAVEAVVLEFGEAIRARKPPEEMQAVWQRLAKVCSESLQRHQDAKRAAEAAH
jgi:hypothetical protein